MADLTGQPDPMFDVAGGAGDQAAPWSWVPQEWIPQPIDPVDVDLATAFGQAPPPAPAPQQLGGAPQIEETAAPVPAAIPAPVSGAPRPVGPPDVSAALDELGFAQPVIEPGNEPPHFDFTEQDAAQVPAWDAPDAVTSADPRAGLDAYANVSYPEGARVSPEQDQAQRDDAEFASILQKDPVQFALYMAKQDDAKRAALEKSLAEKSVADQVEAARIETTYREARQKADDDTASVRANAAALANEKQSPDGGFWASRTDGQRVAAFLSVIIGGLYEGRTGRANPGLAMLNAEVERHVAAQRANFQQRQSMLDRQRGYIGEDLSRAAELRQHDSTQRLAAWERVKQDLATEAQNFDPNGTRAIRTRQIVGQISAQQAQLLEKQRKDALAEHLQLAELDNKMLDAAKKRGALASFTGSGSGVGDKTKLTSEQLAAQLPPGAWVPPKGWTGTLAEYSKLAEAAHKGQDVTKGASEAGANTRAFRVGREGEFMQADGTEFKPATKEEGEKLRSTKGALDAINQFANEIERGIAEHGGESDFFKSADWQKQKSRHATIVALTSKALELGALDEGTQKLTEQMAGGVDPTSFWRDARPGIRQLVNGLAGKFNASMNSNSYTGEPYKPAEAGDLPAPKKDAVDAAHEEASKSRWGYTIDSTRRPGGNTTGNLAEGLGEIGMGTSLTSLKRDSESEQAKAPTLERLNALYTAATRSPGADDRKKAVGYLKNLATEGPTEEVRKTAYELWHSAEFAQAGKAR